MQRSAVRSRRSTAQNPDQLDLFSLLTTEPEPEPSAPAPVAVRGVFCTCGGQPGQHTEICAITTQQKAKPAVTAAPALTVPSGTVSRTKANLRAIATLRLLEQEDRPAKADELTDLAAWSGWGAVPEMFDPKQTQLDWAREQLAGLLDEAQIAAASRSTLNAHYTDPRIVAAMWEAVKGLGFTGGMVLEPGCGSGNFLATAPAGTTVTGVELDPTTAAIAQARCPNAQVLAKSFADVRLPDDQFDLVIGNVPFAKVTLHDKVHNQGKHSIHNHFIIKALHLTRPGGLVAVLTSRYTLDSLDDAARLEMHALADLLGAVRLPSDAHLRNAGTRVVMDLLIIRRRETDRPAIPAPWLTVHRVMIDGEQVPVNDWMSGYRVEGPQQSRHPSGWVGSEWVLGKLATKNGAYRAGDLSVEQDKRHSDLIESLNTILAVNVIAPSFDTGLRWAPRTDPAPAALPEPDAEVVQEGHISHRPDGTFARAERSRWTEARVPATQAKELTALLGLRDAALAVLTEESRSEADTPRLTAMRDQLAAEYNAYVTRYGHLNRFSLRRTGRFHPETGEPLYARVRPPMGGFRTDPYAPLVFALEDFDPEAQTAAPAPIITRRVIVPRIPASHTDTPADALAICLDTHGQVDLGVIAGLLGTSEEDARAGLGTLVFDDPERHTLVVAAEYLSGDVRAKLCAAEAVAANDPAYEPNVKALRDVIPSDLTPAEIDARLGAAWIDADIIQQFLREILEDSRLTVDNPGGQVWSVEGAKQTVRARSTWGTERYTAPDLAQTLLEQRRVEVRDCVSRNPDVYILNLEETAAAMEKAAEMQERFAGWLWEDPQRAATLVRLYNDRFNNIVLRSYDGIRLTLPGLSAGITLHDHQHAAVARIISEPAALLAHEVGAGKTLSMICGAMELRRLGLVRKPCVVVPNHMLDQFAGEWLRAYPLARVLVTRQEDLQGGNNRRRLVARVATGDWDAVIMSSSAFERIPLRPRAVMRYLEQETEQLHEWLATARQSRSRTVKRLEATLLRATERIKTKLAGVKDLGVHFEDTGIDYLFVDEAHRYKNLRTVSAIPGGAIDGSQRASDMDMKVGWLRARNGRRVVTFATATPVANSITEMHVVIRYLRPDLLATAGVDVFDTWAATFGELVTEVELAPEGGGTFRLNTRFARFRNVPELLRMFHVFADVKTSEDLHLPTPLLAARETGERTAQPVTVAPSLDLEAYVAELGERATKIRNREVRPEDDNMLKISGDGRAAALDLRLVGLPQNEPGKIAAAAENIYRIWVANRHRQYPIYPAIEGQLSPIKGAFQLVFCDLGTPKDAGLGTPKDAGLWSAYRELRDQLAKLGMPENQVRFIHDAKTDRAKAQLFAACRSGNVAVLIGSTEKMGVGTNVQHRAIALHHLDAPWRPADVAQRDGRIMRQRNCNPEVAIYRYAVTGSFDGYMWQTLERKAKFIAAIMRGRLDVREIEDIGDTALSYAEVKALATGNPLLMEQAKAASALTVLQRAERAHNHNQGVMRFTIKDMTQRAENLRRDADETATALTIRKDISGDKFTMTVEGEQFDKRTEAAPALSEAIRILVGSARHHGTAESNVGYLAGFGVHVRVVLWRDAITVYISLAGVPGSEMNMGPSEARSGMGLLHRLEHRLGKLEDHRAQCLAAAERCDREAVHAAEQMDAPFPKATELAAAEAEMARIETALAELARGDKDRVKAA